ncbi:uncharacterized protein A4U43_C01F20900 [Asparagus officinalis]|uniref:NPH3 domain-containing protein n=1 Tax=Asparagus officinalis TaxID=4686 RepID=A0A5P1FVE0_ASPOF|nr:uncharacterized protein A4U43_C01F20900 [Asparagus officinalis]
MELKEAHPNITKQEKWTLSKLIDPRKLTPDATLHAVHSDRLPVRSVIQILFSEQTRLGRANEWTGNSFHGTKSLSPSPALDAPGRCPSKREVLGQQREMRKLQEDVGRLQMQCQALQAQVEKLSSEKKKRGMFRWGNFLFRNGEAAERSVDDYEAATERRTPRTPMEGRKGRMVHGRGTPPKWRNSLS